LSFDIALDYNTGDIIMAPNMDIQGRTGPDVYEQRIRIRLKIQRGTWELDPTDGELGSRLLELARMPAQRALVDVEQYVREALAPMDDIVVENVESRFNVDTQTAVEVDITYIPKLDEGEAPAEASEQTVSLTIATPTT
jgi:phage gp46-like protein